MKILEKGKDAGNQNFLHFIQCFLPFQNQLQILSNIYFVVCNYFQFWQVSWLEFCCLVNGYSRNNFSLEITHTGSSRLFVGVSLGKTLQTPSLVLVKPRKDMNNISCCHDMIEILLKWCRTTFNQSVNQSINQSINQSTGNNTPITESSSLIWFTFS